MAVVGTSGSGKSVFMQELVTSLRGLNGQVYIIDKGNSFKKSCLMQGGQHISFDPETPICINPFSLISEKDMDKKEYQEEIINFIQGIVCQMCSPDEALPKFQKEIIIEAVMETWKKHKRSATITNISDYLLEKTEKLKNKGEGDTRISDLPVLLQSYCKGGISERYFEGECSIHINNPFMVFEMEKLDNKPELRMLVIMTLMFIVSQAVYNGDRTVRTSLVLDEAWQLLKGNETTAAFIESYARTARKYEGNLIVGTQGIDDFYKNPAAKAALDNSNVQCFLLQNNDSINQMKKDEKVSMDEQKMKDLKSLMTLKGQYSEVLIQQPSGYAIGRLLLDRYSLALYSSKGDEYAAVESLVKNNGYKLEDALEVYAGYELSN
jgi:conjugal transfer ATP-binding protein TraC